MAEEEGVCTPYVCRAAYSVLHVHMRAVLLGFHPVMKIKATKINSDSYFRLFTKIGTPENYP